MAAARGTRTESTAGRARDTARGNSGGRRPKTDENQDERALVGIKRAGADWILPAALSSRKEYEEFIAHVDAPLAADMGGFSESPLLTIDQLADLGYAYFEESQNPAYTMFLA